MSVPADEPGRGRFFVVVMALVAVTAAVAVPGIVWLLTPPVAAPLPSRTTTRATVLTPSRTVVPTATPAPIPVTAVPVTTTPSAPGPSPRASLDQKPPSPVGNLRMVSSTATSVTIAWDPAVDNVGVAHYVVLQDGTPAVAATVTIVRLDWLRRGTQILVQVAARDAAGNQCE